MPSSHWLGRAVALAPIWQWADHVVGVTDMIAPAQQGETLDAICWRILGRTAGVTEQALELNPGLAALGAQLPGGTIVTLPAIAATAAPVRETVSLWD